MKNKNQFLKRIPIILLILALIGLTLFDIPPGGIKNLGLDRLNQTNDKYLDTSLKQALGTFAVLSGIKVALAIVEGTKIGVGFGIEVGDAVQSVYDYIDIAWRTVLASAAILTGTKYLLKTADIVDQGFLLMTLILVLIGYSLNWRENVNSIFQRILKDVTLFMTILTLALYILLPLSVTGGRFLSERITKPIITEAESNIAVFHKELDLKQSKQGSGIMNQLVRGKDQVVAITKLIAGKATNLSMWILKIIAGYLFDAIVFPLLLFIFFLWLTKTVARYFFQLQQQQTFREDLERIAVKYLVQKNEHHSIKGEKTL